MKINNDSYRSDPTCIAVIGSMTMALKAQRLLASRTLRAEVIKVAHATAKRGCIYGLEFACALTGSVRATLEERGIEIKEFLR